MSLRELKIKVVDEQEPWKKQLLFRYSLQYSEVKKDQHQM